MCSHTKKEVESEDIESLEYAIKDIEGNLNILKFEMVAPIISKSKLKETFKDIKKRVDYVLKVEFKNEKRR